LGKNKPDRAKGGKDSMGFLQNVPAFFGKSGGNLRLEVVF
jgi:hypothetical protein